MQTESNVVLGSLALILLAASPSLAGSPASPTPGDHLRATVRDGREGKPRTLRGDLVSADGDTLVLARRAGLDPYRVARADVVELERRSREGNRMRSVGAGLLATTVIAVAIGVAEGSDPPGAMFSMSAGEKAVLGSVLLMPVGVLLGLASSHGDAWEPVEPTDLRLGVGPTADGGGAFAVSVGF